MFFSFFCLREKIIIVYIFINTIFSKWFQNLVTRFLQKNCLDFFFSYLGTQHTNFICVANSNKYGHHFLNWNPERPKKLLGLVESYCCLNLWALFQIRGFPEVRKCLSTGEILGKHWNLCDDLLNMYQNSFSQAICHNGIHQKIPNSCGNYEWRNPLENSKSLWLLQLSDSMKDLQILWRLLNSQVSFS